MLHKLKQGYARLLDAPVEALDRPGFSLVATPAREQPEWANWLFPVWLFAIGPSLICSVSPPYAGPARTAFESLSPQTLLDAETLTRARQVIDDRMAAQREWVQCELFFYPHSQPPDLAAPYPVEKLQPGDEQAIDFLRNFDGGAYGLRAENGQIIAHACIKNKGLLQEIAVGVEAGYRRRGLAKAVVAQAIAAILNQGKVPVYWPDSPRNTASYRLAAALGFQKAAEMCFCCYELPGWAGFPLPGAFHFGGEFDHS
jgi:RimJ/RimL family protein N-acetyltransferase